jgi:predicted enzyme related to lactoylglutathione lyase
MDDPQALKDLQVERSEVLFPMSLLVNIDVDDLGKAVAFYEAAFGLTVSRRLGDSIVEMTGAPSPIYLLEKPAASKASDTNSETRRYERHWTPVHLDFVVDDIDQAVRRAQAAGARLEKPATTANWGRLAAMADPFGHGFCLVQFLGRGYDEIATLAAGGSRDAEEPEQKESV